jgi:hypothetical protein
MSLRGRTRTGYTKAHERRNWQQASTIFPQVPSYQTGDAGDPRRGLRPIVCSWTSRAQRKDFRLWWAAASGYITCMSRVQRGRFPGVRQHRLGASADVRCACVLFVSRTCSPAVVKIGRPVDDRSAHVVILSRVPFPCGLRSSHPMASPQAGPRGVRPDRSIRRSERRGNVVRRLGMRQIPWNLHLVSCIAPSAAVT